MYREFYTRGQLTPRLRRHSLAPGIPAAEEGRTNPEEDRLMKKLLVSLAALAVFSLPVGAHAADHCRNAKGQFAKCGTPGAMPAGMKMTPAAKSAPAAKPMMAAKAGPCKDAKGKFIKCGTAAAPAVVAKPAPMVKPAPVAAAPAKKGPCKDAKGKFVKC
jgi:hypothetical protein